MTPLLLTLAALLLLALPVVVYAYRHAPIVEPVREDTGEYDNE